jgi:hypothetical protein
MEEFKNRQIKIAVKSIDDFCNKKLNLNTLVQRIEGIKDALEDGRLSGDLYKNRLILEEINGLAISEDRSLSDEEQAIVERELSEMRQILSGYLA